MGAQRKNKVVTATATVTHQAALCTGVQVRVLILQGSSHTPQQRLAQHHRHHVRPHDRQQQLQQLQRESLALMTAGQAGTLHKVAPKGLQLLRIGGGPLLLVLLRLLGLFLTLQIGQRAARRGDAQFDINRLVLLRVASMQQTNREFQARLHASQLDWALCCC
mgnify:CR=1 FL=1